MLAQVPRLHREAKRDYLDSVAKLEEFKTGHECSDGFVGRFGRSETNYRERYSTEAQSEAVDFQAS